MGPLLLLLAGAVACTTTSPECTERMPVGLDGKWTLLYRSHALTTRNERIEEAFVLVHGQSRNADDYFRTAMAAGFLAGALDRTIIISPRFASNDGTGCKDVLAEGEINQPCRGNTWRGGGNPVNAKDASSFHATDELLRHLADRRVFPNLKRIVLAGHSAGGQFVHRYAAASRAVESVGVPVKLIVSNPSSYLYLDARRPGADGKLAEFAGKEACPAFNRYLYGLEQRSGYAEQVPDETLRANLVKREVVYLLGELDTEPLAGFDSSCSGMAQGKNRFVRGENYWKMIRAEFGARHEMVQAPMCGHNARCVFTTDAALKAVFGR